MDPSDYRFYADKAKANRDRLDSDRSALESIRQKRWTTLAAGDLPRMLENKKSASDCLSHQSWRVRQTAIEVLVNRWHALSDHEFKHELSSMAFCDPEINVRVVALLSFCKAYSATFDSSVGVLLATVAYDETAEPELRWLAYGGLYQLEGRRSPTWKGLRGKRCRPVVPKEIDWRVVNHFLISFDQASFRGSFKDLPDNVQARLLALSQGLAAYLQGAFALAVSHLTEAIRATPNAIGLLHKRGHAYLEIGNYEAAVRDLSLVVTHAPTSESLRLRGAAYAGMGDIELAERDLEESRRLEGSEDFNGF